MAYRGHNSIYGCFSYSCCLAGRAYPLGDIPEDLVVQVKHQVCRCSYTSVKVLTKAMLFFEILPSDLAFQLVTLVTVHLTSGNMTLL